MSASKSKLFEPLKLAPSLEIPNRIIVSPMCQYSAENGLPNEWHLVHIGSMATHGCSTIVVEATAVLPNGRITPGCTGIWSDEHTEAHKRVVDFVKKHTKSVIGIQIGHAGRKASSMKPWLAGGAHTILAEEKDGGWPNEIYAPSAIPWDNKSGKPKELSKEQIKQYVQAFGDAALRAVKAGYQFIEIHSAHGYLLHEFLSPLTNKRTDEYGGSFENRTRAVREIAAEIRSRVGADFPLGIRFSCQDWVEGGWSVEETANLALQLTEKPFGLHFIDCSSGGAHPTQQFPNPIPPGYQVPFAKAVKAKIGSRANVITVGYIYDPHQAEDILNTTGLDAVMLARQILREPSFTFRAASLLGANASYSYPSPYGYAIAGRDPPPYVKPDAVTKPAPANAEKKASSAGFWLHVGSILIAGAAVGFVIAKNAKKSS
jgi:2,4-dienoyl-CoA reductase-like NADH-dependent reductase (Old Yellow Enzyme family)